MRPHFPECYLYEHDDVGHFDESECDKDCVGPCICDRLRACEERVREGKRQDVADARTFGYGEGFAAGVQAAYSAVELRWQKVADAASDWLLVALAAIDALTANADTERNVGDD